MHKAKNIPQLRFKEFEGEWRETTLGNLFTFKNGLNSEKEKYGSGIKFINVLDIIGEDVITYDSIIGKVEVTEKELEKNEVIYGDVLFQRSSETREEVGQANVYVDKNNSAVFGGFVIRGRKKEEYNPYFMNYLLKTSPARNEITTKSGGSTRFNVGQVSLSEVFVNFPSLPEQQKIAAFLSAVDGKIQQLTKKKTLLEDYKKGVMQQLFKGKLRFKDENGNPYPDWEKKKLGEVMKISKKVKPKNFDVNRLLTVKLHTKGLFRNERTESLKLGATNYFVRTKGQFIYGKQNLFNGAFGIIPEKFDGFYSSSDIPALDFIEGKVVPCFVLFYLSRKSYYDRLENIASGSGSKRIHETTFLEININFPCLEEQQKIATFLSGIDTKIENVNTQITQSQTFKKGLLQQLFV